MPLGFNIDPGLVAASNAFSGAIPQIPDFTPQFQWPGAGQSFNYGSWMDSPWTSIGASAGGGLLKGLAASLMGGGGGGRSRSAGRMSLPSRLAALQFAEWLAALSSDPGRVKF